jgi:hypothetical protein
MHLLPKFALSGLLALSLSSLTYSAQAQVNININSPSWGPAAPAGTQYYYVPEYGGYYDLRDQQYIVQREGRWTRMRTISGYSPNNFHPVVINYVGTQPWVLIREHKVKYPKGGHPHGMPPGQAKKARVVYAVPAGQPVYVVEGKGKGHGKGNKHGEGHGKGKH